MVLRRIVVEVSTTFRSPPVQPFDAIYLALLAGANSVSSRPLFGAAGVYVSTDSGTCYMLGSVGSGGLGQHPSRSGAEHRCANCRIRRLRLHGGWHYPRRSPSVTTIRQKGRPPPQRPCALQGFTSLTFVLEKDLPRQLTRRSLAPSHSVAVLPH
jgi:hypothetical protein